MAKILLLEDDPSVSLGLKECLETAHHKVDAAPDGEVAMEYLRAFSYDLLILDRQVPHMSGIEICKYYRTISSGPVLMLTGLSGINQKVEGLDAGADDYLTKPFSMDELLARVRALLRRPTEMFSEQISFAEFVVNTRSKVVKKAGVEIELTPREYEVLEYFLKHPNEVVSTDSLLKRVWHSDANASQQAVYTCINRLRKSLKPEDKEAIIKTVHGLGYRLEM